MKIVIISALWCPSCLKMGKIYKQLKDEFENIEFISYDLDFDEEEVQKYNPGDTLPILIVLNNEIELKRVVGEYTKEELITEIRSILNEK